MKAKEKQRTPVRYFGANPLLSGAWDYKVSQSDRGPEHSGSVVASLTKEPGRGGRSDTVGFPIDQRLREINYDDDGRDGLPGGKWRSGKKRWLSSSCA